MPLFVEASEVRLFLTGALLVFFTAAFLAGAAFFATAPPISKLSAVTPRFFEGASENHTG